MTSCQCVNRRHSNEIECKFFSKTQHLIAQTEFNDSNLRNFQIADGASEEVLKFFLLDEPIHKKIAITTTTKHQPIPKKRKIQQHSPFVQLFQTQLDLVKTQLLPCLEDYSDVSHLIQTCQTIKETSQELWKEICWTDYPNLFDKKPIEFNNFQFFKQQEHTDSYYDEATGTFPSVPFVIEKFWSYQFGEILQQNLLRNGAVVKEPQGEVESLKVRDWGKQIAVLYLWQLMENMVRGHAFQVGDSEEEMDVFVIDAPEMVGKRSWTQKDFFKAIDLVEEDCYEDGVSEEKKSDFKSLWRERSWENEEGSHKLWDEEAFSTEPIFELKKVMDEWLYDVRPITILCDTDGTGGEFRLVLGVAESGHFVGAIASGTY